ncbi:nitroreductase [Chloroflexota bacterium]
MDLIEAIKSRRSIRGFKQEPVSRDILTEVLQIARQAPSGVNAQTWEFVVLTGDTLEMIKQANEEHSARGVEPHPNLGYVPLTGSYLKRQVELGAKLYKLLGIAREDKDRRREWGKKGLRFFDAPAAILICDDQETPQLISLFNLGIVTQTIALAALHFGLGTCIQRAAVNYPDIIREITGIPKSKRIYVSIAIGYPDREHPANKLHSSREPLRKLTTWVT